MRLGFVGFGSQGAKYARIMGELQQEITCVAQPWLGDHTALETLCPEAMRVKSPEEVIESACVDAVVVTRPAGGAAVIHEALLAGKHVLADAPLASTHSEACELAKLAQQRGRVLLVAHTPLFHRGLQAIKEWVDKPETGELQAVSLQSSRPAPLASSRELWSFLSQEVAVLVFLLERLPQGLWADWKRRDDAFESASLSTRGRVSPTVDCKLQFASSPTVSRASDRIEVRTDRGRAVMEQLDPDRSVLHMDEERDCDTDESAPEDVLRREIRLEDPHRSLCDHFTKCIEDRVPARSDGDFGANVVAALERARQ